MRAWRLCRRRYAAFDGEGARLYGGRWNNPGTPMIYTSESPALAALELLVHIDPGDAPSDLVMIPAEVDGLPMTSVRERDLPPRWRRTPAPAELKTRGDVWARELKSAVLVVPSAIIPRQRKFLFNPLHPHFSRLKVGKPEPFAFDARLLKRSRS